VKFGLKSEAPKVVVVFPVIAFQSTFAAYTEKFLSVIFAADDQEGEAEAN